jgi:hypothetical protein
MHNTQKISSVFSWDLTVCVKSMKQQFGTGNRLGICFMAEACRDCRSLQLQKTRLLLDSLNHQFHLNRSVIKKGTSTSQK